MTLQTLHNRNVNLAHRMLKSRQDNNPISDAITPGQEGGGNDGKGNNNNGGGASGADSLQVPPAVSSQPPPPASSSQPPAQSSVAPPKPSSSPSSTPSATPVTKPSSTSVQQPPSSSDTSKESSTAQSSSSSSPSSSGSDSSSASTSSTASITGTTARITSTPSQTLRDQSSSFRTLARTTVDSSGATITADALPSTEATGGVSTGTIVGGVAGGIAGVAVLCLIVAFILRRMRKRSRNLDDDYNPSDFRRSAFVADNNAGSPTLPDMTQRGHTVAPSISGGPGMAGHGAYQGQHGDVNYGAAAVGAGVGVGAAVAAGTVLQERPRYTYGQDYTMNNASNTAPALDDDGSEIAHGAYSSQPQMQAAYNPEAYGSYAAYEGGAGYQEATREYQGQQGQQQQYYDDHQEYQHYYDQQQQHQQYNDYVVPGTPAVTAPAGGAPSSNRAANTRSIVADDDAYGGI
ncbi:hypothetical protein BDQ12DRAFT_664932 [Crucibulum laeve]|uniref:Mid2 domain-containing protein n=1 Tax=Crucibulum laeve TaxID=68775 RepID=A0A5C3M5N6_9AGAR|nr:hypothetical protein BDQ12DRAFT_664932 [Crucibulum laeve]